MKRIARVRWTADERAAVIRRAQILLAEDPRTTSVALFAKSQDELLRERRRPGTPNARAWLRDEVKRAGPLLSRATIGRPERPPTDETMSRARRADESSRAASSAEHPGDAVATRSKVVSALIEAGVEVLTGVLADPRVRSAVIALMQGERTGAATPHDAPRDGEDAAPTRDLIVVAGCSADEARSLKKELHGTLPVTFWAADEPRERLLDLLPKAELVIGVSSGLPQTVESSLARLGARYVRHSGGMPALYRRLAEQALR